MPTSRSDSVLPFHPPTSLRPGWPALLLALVVALAPGAAIAAQLQLSWVDNSDGQAGFRIERKASAEPAYSELALEAPGVTSYTDPTVVAGATYCYRVQAYNELGVSAYSNEACGSTAPGLVLGVSVGGTGQGHVGSSPAGIDCSPTCSASYASGALVTLAAFPAAGSTFGGWNGGGCSGTDPCTLTGNTPVTVGATFTPAPAAYTLTVNGQGPGTVTSVPAGIDCGSDCSQGYGAGTSVTLTATASSGARFLGWSGGGCSGTGPCTVTVAGATSVTATFTKSKGRK